MTAQGASVVSSATVYRGPMVCRTKTAGVLGPSACWVAVAACPPLRLRGRQAAPGTPMGQTNCHWHPNG